MKKVFMTMAVVAGLALLFEVARNVYFFYSPNSPDASYKVILVEPGNLAKTAEYLYHEGVIRDPRRFRFIIRLLGKTGAVRVGEYEVQLNMSPAQVLRVITTGKSVLHAVHIPEGFNLEQIADQLAQQHLVDPKEFVETARNPHMAQMLGVDEPTLEGYLFPETYSFTRFTGTRAILKTMVDKFKEVYNRDIRFAAEKENKSMHEVVTLASMVEKETGAAQERAIIASVFFNRLKLHMPLQSDPTVIYGKVGDKKNITRKDLITPTPYNTYTRHGLPVGPICNPGRDSLLAVVEPAQTHYLYFVSMNNGTHVFSANYAEHVKYVRKYQLDPKAREGKSWHDLYASQHGVGVGVAKVAQTIPATKTTGSASAGTRTSSHHTPPTKTKSTHKKKKSEKKSAQKNQE